MKSKIITSIVLLFTLLSGFVALPMMVSAQTTVNNEALDFNDGISICDFIPPICNALGITGEESNVEQTAASFLRARLSLVLSIIFVGIILISVVIIIQAGVKYIQSQGNEGKIEEAQKAIKNVFIGIAIMFVGIVGIILVLAFFNGTGLLSTEDVPEELNIFNESGSSANPNTPEN